MINTPLLFLLALLLGVAAGGNERSRLIDSAGDIVSPTIHSCTFELGAANNDVEHPSDDQAHAVPIYYVSHESTVGLVSFNSPLADASVQNDLSCVKNIAQDAFEQDYCRSGSTRVEGALEHRSVSSFGRECDETVESVFERQLAGGAVALARANRRDGIQFFTTLIESAPEEHDEETESGDDSDDPAPPEATVFTARTDTIALPPHLQTTTESDTTTDTETDTDTLVLVPSDISSTGEVGNHDGTAHRRIGNISVGLIVLAVILGVVCLIIAACLFKCLEHFCGCIIFIVFAIIIVIAVLLIVIIVNP